MDAIDIVETHISTVILVGDDVYKIKKRVNLGFVDFTTLASREHFCREEVRLNRRLAPDVYRGVVPIRRAGEIEDWAVRMRRLPAEATLESRLRAGRLDARHLDEVARVMAHFHAHAETNAEICAGGSFATVANNCRENFDQTGPSCSPVWERVRHATELALEAARPRIEQRAALGVPRDTHGDLRLGHVYLLTTGVTIIDCVEFAPRFRHADPVADTAFLTMELHAEGRPDLAAAFSDAWFSASGDDGDDLLEFYVAYRSVVRAKVRGMEAAQVGIRPAQRARAALRARGHWLLALARLEPAARRPGLLVLCGLPGTGKSTLAAHLAADHGFHVVRTDVVRQEIGCADYSDASKALVDAATLARVGTLLDDGRRVVVDAGLWTAGRRVPFVAAAHDRMLPRAIVPCEADRDEVRRRLRLRQGDASDADWRVYESAEALWEPADAEPIRTDVDDGGRSALRATLRSTGLAT